ncbi:MAG: hypothetical protein WCD44_02835 [Candidatus Babeliales bacterium]|jgi:hypothetical protein
MNRQIKIFCLGLMSFALATGMQVQALPSFKKTAGLLTLAVGARYTWVNRNNIKNTVQELKENSQKFLKNQFALCKKKMNNGKELLPSAIAQLKFLKSWIRQKVTGLFTKKTKREMISSETVVLGDPNLESNIS